MTADGTDRPTRRRALALPVALGIALGAVACSSAGSGSDDHGTDTGLSYAEVRSTAGQLTGNSPCPFGLDLAAAFKGAGIDLAVEPGAKDRQSVDTEVGDGVPAQPWPSGITPSPTTASMPAVPPSAWITCTWSAGSTRIRVDLLAVPQNNVAVNLLLPHIQRYGELSVDRLREFAAARPEPGGSVVTPGDGLLALARVRAAGTGDLALTVTQDPGPGPVDKTLAGEPLRRTVERLAAQLHA